MLKQVQHDTHINDMKSFWHDLPKPFFALAPMEGATDSVFRRVIASIGKPDVFFTEFTNVEGLFSAGSKEVEKRLLFTSEERPIIAQIWGLKPELFFKAAKLIAKRGFDGIDINMGCPQRSVTSDGACSALIKNPLLAKEIIQAAREGAANLPISVKTRIGFANTQIEDWIDFLLQQNINALTLHLRTVKEMSDVPARWEEMTKIVKLRNEINKNTVLIGNGDVKSIKEGREKAKLYGIEGIMIGRAVFENPWVFKKDIDPNKITVKNRIDLLKLHLELYEKEKYKLSFQTLKKYFKIYIRDFIGASELRMKLMETNSVSEAIKIINSMS